MPTGPDRHSLFVRTRLFTAALVAIACQRRSPPPHHSSPIVAAPVAAPSTPVRPVAAWTDLLTIPVPAASTPLEVAVHVPARLDLRRPVHAVVYFHGGGECAAEFTWAGAFEQRLCHRPPGRGDGWAFSALHDVAHTNTVFVVPQLHTGRDGGLARPGGFRVMLSAVAREVAARAGAPPFAFAGTVLAAQSLGGPVLLDALAFADVAANVRAVFLFDTLGARPEVLIRWWKSSPDHHLVIAYGGVHGAAALAHAVVDGTRPHAPGALVTRVGDFTRDLARAPMVVFPTALPHHLVSHPYFTKSLAALGLPTRDLVEPWELAPDSTTTLAVGASVEGQLPEGDARRSRDYAIALATGQCVDLTLTGGRARWEPRDRLDPRLQLFVDGHRVLDDDDGVGADHPGTERFDSRARWCASAAQTLVARASSRTGAWHGGAFTLAVRSSVATVQ